MSFLTTNEKLTLHRSTFSESDFSVLSRERVERLLNRRLRCRDFDPSSILRDAEGDRKRLTVKKIEYTFYEDTDYPPQLREIYNPPFLLFYRGELPDYQQPLLGIVGTRRPTGSAGEAAFRLGYDAGTCGISVVSGLAKGIDGFAHEGNLDGGGKTVAVLGCGIDSVYPVCNRSLGLRILEGGGTIFSEYPPGEPPLRYHFPARNRVLSGLCRTMVVVEAPERSGALITADHALDQGRDLLVHSAGLEGANGAGLRRLADDGAPVIDGMNEILEEWGYGHGYTQKVEPSEVTPGNLASMMRAELAGDMVAHRGKYFRRVVNG